MPVVARPKPGLDIVQRGREAGHVRLLRQIAHGGAGLHEAGTAIRCHQPGGDLEQGRFAGTIAPDQADALAGGHADFGAGEQRLSAKGRTDVLQKKERGCHAGCLAPSGGGCKPGQAIKADAVSWRRP